GISRTVAPGSGYSVASRINARTVTRTTVAPALGPRVRSTLMRPLESVTARVAPSCPLVTPRVTPSPATGVPAVSRTWNTRGSAGRVPTEPCCPTPRTNPVAVVDTGARGEVAAAGAGAGAAPGGGATIRCAVRAAGCRRVRRGRGWAAAR